MTDVWQGLVIVGMGNPLLTDDGVGHHAARALGSDCFPGAVVHTIPMVGMELLDLIAGYDSLCLVDAVTTGKRPIGAADRFPLPGPGLHSCSSHGPDLHSVLSLGHSLHLNIPQITLLYGIEIGTEIAYGEDLTPALRARFKTAILQIAEDMRTLFMRKYHFGWK